MGSKSKMQFGLSDVEYSRFEKWRTLMNKKYSPEERTGGHYTFCFTPTGIGSVVIVKRNTGEEIDITDNENW